MNPEEQLKIEIAIIKEKIISIQESIDGLKTNHLDHIYKAIEDLKNEMKATKDEVEKLKIKVAYYSGGLAIILLIIQYFVN